MPIPGGFGVAPTVALSALSSPSPGVRVTCTLLDATTQTIDVWRTSASQGRVLVRGAARAIAAGSFGVDDFEAPIGELLTYTAATYDIADVSSDESVGVTITLSTDRAWLTDPILPNTAAQVTIRDFSTRRRKIDADLLLPIGATRPLMVSGTRQAGEGTLVLATTSLAGTRDLRELLERNPVLLLRAPSDDYDIGAEFLGITDYAETRYGKIREGGRYFSLEVTYVQRPDPSITGPLWTWDDLAASGKTWSQVAASGYTWLQLKQLGPPP